MMKKISLILIIVFGTLSAYSQKKWQKYGYEIAFPVCYALDSVVNSHIPVDPEILQKLKSAESKSTISVTYSLFPQNARNAFEYAVGIWEKIIESPVTIHLRANWRRMDQNVLGSCGPTNYLTNFDGIPFKNRYYPISVAEKITKTEITGPDNPDMQATFNRDIDWYFGIDGNTPDSLYDFVSVVLHEIAHGLGYSGFFFVNGNLGNYEYYEIGEAAAFDILVEKNNGDLLTDTTIFKIPSEELKKALESGQLYANSQEAISAGDGVRPRLYSPFNWDDGSSIYHLNDATYPSGNPNSLMTHAFGRGESIHKVGPINEGILADIGWRHLFIEFEPLKDREEVVPLSFNVRIESEYQLDTLALFIVFSYDSFEAHSDTVSLLPADNESGLFTAEIIPPANTDAVEYYISATDEKTRTFRKPAEAPAEIYSIKFGPDTEEPEITHNPIAYYFTVTDVLPVSAKVTDNFDVDSVFVEYSVNGVPMQSFGLKNDTASNYSGQFPFNNNLLNDGDEIKYHIIAVDASSAGNTSRLPVEEDFEFRIEKVLNPVAGYTSDFENPSSDFILSDFDIYTETGFENNALHSPHPYPSPETDDSVFNFTTILKNPVILQEGGTMGYDEIVLVEPGSAGTIFGDDNFWDFVIVEGSKDEGKTWLPLADGYDSRENDIWEENYNQTVEEQVSLAAGVPEWYIYKEINLLENNNFSAGDTILIRFRLFSDPYAHGWGWAIDNLRIQFPTPTTQTVLSPGNIRVYPNPFSEKIKIRITPKAEVKNLYIDIFNTFGQKIKSLFHAAESSQFENEIDMTGFAAGMYFLTVNENSKQIFSKKIIKN